MDLDAGAARSQVHLPDWIAQDVARGAQQRRWLHAMLDRDGLSYAHGPSWESLLTRLAGHGYLATRAPLGPRGGQRWVLHQLPVRLRTPLRLRLLAGLQGKDPDTVHTLLRAVPDTDGHPVLHDLAAVIFPLRCELDAGVAAGNLRGLCTSVDRLEDPNDLARYLQAQYPTVRYSLGGVAAIAQAWADAPDQAMFGAALRHDTRRLGPLRDMLDRATALTRAAEEARA